MGTFKFSYLKEDVIINRIPHLPIFDFKCEFKEYRDKKGSNKKLINGWFKVKLIKDRRYYCYILFEDTLSKKQIYRICKKSQFENKILLDVKENSIKSNFYVDIDKFYMKDGVFIVNFVFIDINYKYKHIVSSGYRYPIKNDIDLRNKK